MSVWKTAATSLRLNAAAGDHPVPVSPDNARRAARPRARSANGPTASSTSPSARSPTSGSSTGPGRHVPTRDEIAARLPLIDYRRSEVDEAAGTAFLQAQGHARAPGRHRQGLRRRSRRAILRERGFRDFMIQAGGDLYVAGQHGDRPWRLGIADPRGPTARLRDPRSERRHVQHLGRLRALLHQGRRPLSPHPRPGDGRARARLPQRHASSPTAACWPTGSPPACSSSVRTRAWRSSSACRTWRASSSRADNEVLVSSGLKGRFEIAHRRPTHPDARTSRVTAQAGRR